MKNKYVKTAVVLSGICAVAAILLAFVNMVTAPRIAEYEKKVFISALEEVSCGYKINIRTEVKDDKYVTYYYSLTSSSNTVGYLLNLKANGYGGELNIVATYSLDGKLLAAKLVSDSETPGLGKKAENPSYMDKFIGLDVIPTSKTMLSDKDALSVAGASMTFNGISKALAYGSSFVKNNIKGGK